MTAANDDAAEFGLRSDKLKLLAGDYQVITFALYNKIDEVVYECKENGVQIMPRKEIERLKGEWNEKQNTGGPVVL